MNSVGVRLLVYSSLFPSDKQPNAGLFIRERMFRVAKHVPIVVVAPQAWFPGQGLIRLFRPHFRPMAPRFEVMNGIEVHRPRFLCVPGVLKRTDGMLMALSTLLTVRRVVRRHRTNIIDAHFGYPDGRAATLLGRWLDLPVVITLRGKEARQLSTTVAEPLRRAMAEADQIITVSSALRAVALESGVPSQRIEVVGNGIDLGRFAPIDRVEARLRVGLPAAAKVIISVGTLVERKGVHRVLELMPALLKRHPQLHYIVVGGPGPEGDMSARLRTMAAQAPIAGRVHFLGPITPDDLKVPLSAADVFVLATSYEGWANVFLEAMACGLPIVTTDVGGNAEVVSSEALGSVVPLQDGLRLELAISDALNKSWDHAAIRAYAASNAWDARIPILLASYERLQRNALSAALTSSRKVGSV
jgi:glycosyltransferase involved in cell wall biosynthesis